jgi:hypothetical protein
LIDILFADAKIWQLKQAHLFKPARQPDPAHLVSLPSLFLLATITLCFVEMNALETNIP